MRGRLFRLAAAVSLVLCVATTALWIVSYRWAGGASIAGRWAVTAGKGKLGLHYNSKPEPPGHPFFAWHFEHAGFTSIELLPVFVPLTHTSAATGIYHWQFLLPTWLPAAAFGLSWFVVRRRGSRAPPGACPSCGYDLRATPDRCPECGTAPGGAPRPPA